MEASEREQPLRARERPIREAGSIGKSDCGEPGGIDPGVEKSALGKRNGEGTQHFPMRCSVPCMPVESKAGNWITWNRFLFVTIPNGVSLHP